MNKGVNVANMKALTPLKYMATCVAFAERKLRLLDEPLSVIKNERKNNLFARTVVIGNV